VDLAAGGCLPGSCHAGRGRQPSDPTDGGATGDLVSARVDGTGRKTVLKGASCTGGNAPYWLPDSRHVLVTRGNVAKRVPVDVRDGKVGPRVVVGFGSTDPNQVRTGFRLLDAKPAAP
jgi:hypothetical protein